MTFFRDLSHFGYAHEPDLQTALNVGWLSPFRYCPTEPTTLEFRRKLFDLCSRPQLRYYGYQHCMLGLCKFVPRKFIPALWGITASLNGHAITLGAGIIVVRGSTATYAAPDLIYHYVTRHGYRPPTAFIDAVLASPLSPPDRLSVSRLTCA